MAAKFEIFKGKAGDFRFHLKAANGEIIASGQGYKSKAAAEKGIESVKANAAAAKIEDHTEHEHPHSYLVSAFTVARHDYPSSCRVFRAA